jgi:hypothetical protein
MKLAIRWLKGYRPPRWDDRSSKGRGGERRPAAARLTAFLAWLTVAVLGFCLISAVDARATYLPDQLSFAYHSCIPWLPHSLDSNATWMAFWSCLGLACSFWAVRDWLLGKTEVEERAELLPAGRVGGDAAPLLPDRLRRLLWLLAINGGLLGLEGIAQRLEGSGRLLFPVKPRVNPAAITQFGPYAYRANASQYFNLLWPLCLGLWWAHNHTLGSSRKGHHLILVCCAIMAAARSFPPAAAAR